MADFKDYILGDTYWPQTFPYWSADYWPEAGVEIPGGGALRRRRVRKFPPLQIPPLPEIEVPEREAVVLKAISIAGEEMFGTAHAVPVLKAAPVRSSEAMGRARALWDETKDEEAILVALMS